MNFSRTLIIKPSSMGDIVQALPVLTALKEAHPSAHVSWLVSRPFVGLLEGHPRLEEILVFDRQRFGRAGRSVGALLDLLAFLKGLRQKRFTTVLDLQGLLRSGLAALATGAPSRIGFREAREMAPLFYTAEVALPKGEMHAVDRYLALVRHVGLEMPKAKDHLPVSAEARSASRQRLAEAGLQKGAPYAVLCAYARWETKQWPPERFARVADRLAEATGARAVLVGGEAASPGARAVLAAAKHRPLDLTNQTTLKELVAVIAEGRLMVTDDSGPMHIAAAVGVPVVAVFGPTSARRTGPYGPGHRVLSGRAPCSPCYRRECLYAGPGPKGAGAPGLAQCCLRNIGADEVADVAIEVWRGNP
ncbi:MAG TPA: lipopolysaccharide heptosyltransferase II [Phycisphaerae bacterium]|nr:lipopolysaccharide heptosyltransferase II [Phycisphaerae bacterium]